MRGRPDEQPRDDAAAPEDVVILRRIARGNLAHFDVFVDRYRGKLTSYAFQRLGDLHRAEDIAQEAFLRAFRAAADGGFHGKGSAGPWLFAIARNCMTDFLRERGTKVVPLPADVTAEGGDPSAGDARPAADLLSALPEPQRDVVALKVLCGLAFSEIGEIVGCPTATAKSRMRYGLRKLREVLSQERRVSHD